VKPTDTTRCGSAAIVVSPNACGIVTGKAASPAGGDVSAVEASVPSVATVDSSEAAGWLSGVDAAGASSLPHAATRPATARIAAAARPVCHLDRDMSSPRVLRQRKLMQDGLSSVQLPCDVRQTLYRRVQSARIEMIRCTRGGSVGVSRAWR
jgi:hypothetical protein